MQVRISSALPLNSVALSLFLIVLADRRTGGPADQGSLHERKCREQRRRFTLIWS